ncbi:MAG: Endonuclease/exonuclease/phosphatase, partial [uncultured Nocardioides sp.]
CCGSPRPTPPEAVTAPGPPAPRSGRAGPPRRRRWTWTSSASRRSTTCCPAAVPWTRPPRSPPPWPSENPGRAASPQRCTGRPAPPPPSAQPWPHRPTSRRTASPCSAVIRCAAGPSSGCRPPVLVCPCCSRRARTAGCCGCRTSRGWRWRRSSRHRQATSPSSPRTCPSARGAPSRSCGRSCAGPGTCPRRGCCSATSTCLVGWPPASRGGRPRCGPRRTPRRRRGCSSTTCSSTVPRASGAPRPARWGTATTSRSVPSWWWREAGP